MAAFDTIRPVQSGTRDGGRLSRFVATLFAALAGWNDARVTRKALSRLSDRELDDIGLCRGDIDTLSRRGY